MFEYQRTIRARQVEHAQKLLKLKDADEIKHGANDVKRFLKRVVNGNKDENASISYILDEERIKEEEQYDGFYAIATNLADNAKDIIEISQKRYQIEDCFRIMKTNFISRPVGHREQRRIKAHFMICFTALLVYRLLECSLEDQGDQISVGNLVKTLKNLNVVNVHDIEYTALYERSKALDALNKLAKLDLDRVHYKPKELNQKMKKLLK